MALKKDLLNSYFIIQSNNKLENSKDIPTTTEDNSAKQTQIDKPPFFKIYDNPDYGDKDFIEDTKHESTLTKPRTNIRQTQDIIRPETRTNVGQNSDKLRTNKEVLSVKSKSETRTKDKTNLRHTSDKHRTNLEQVDEYTRENYSYFTLTGLQRSITLFIYECCKQSRDRITMPLSIESIVNSCNTTKLSAQKTIQRLENKQILIRKTYKCGRGGWTQYELKNEIYQEILQSENNLLLRTNIGQNQDKLKTQYKSEYRTDNACSSSFIKYKEISTTGIDSATILPSEWEEINLSELHKRNIQFGHNHLIQIYPSLKNFTAFDFQESIDAFIFDLENGHLKIRTSSVGFLMTIFRGGNLYISQHYTSPERKLILEMAEKTKQRQKEIEEAKFVNWLGEKDREEIKQILDHADLWIGFEHKSGDGYITAMKKLRNKFYEEFNKVNN